MKKILLIICLLVSFVSFGQPTNYTKVEHRYNWLAGYFRALHVPSGTSFGLQAGQWPGAGALYLDTTGADSGFYYRGVNASWHRLPKATETFYLGNGTFSSNRTVSGGGFSLAFNNVSSFSLNSIRDAVVRSDLNVLTDSIVFQPHDGKINIDSLRSGHPTDTTTYKVMVWSPTNKSVRYLTGWPGTGGSSGITGFTDGSGFDGTVTGSDLSLISTVSDDQLVFSNSGALAGSANITYDGTSFTTLSNFGVGQINPNSGSKLHVLGIANYTNASAISGFYDYQRYGNWDAVGSISAAGTTLAIGGYRAAQWSGMNLYVGGSAIQLMTSSLVTFNTETQHELQLKIKDISAPSTPASGYGLHYVNTDKPWFKDDGGNAFEVSLFAVSTTASSATPTPTGHARTNDLDVTALATNPTFAAPSGTPINGNRLVIRIKDDGTPRTLAFNAIYRAGAIALPTTTTTSKTLYLGFIYNSADSKWDLVSSVDQF
jgi:hypothetical protein